MPLATSRASSSQDDQIIVATGHLRVVDRTLREWGVRLDTDQQDEIPELGLTRLFLAALRADVSEMRRDLFLVRAAEAAAAERRPSGAPAATVDDLDLLMFRLRLDSAYRCAGWVPTIGKNRYVETTEALGEIGGGGGGLPELIAQGEIGGGGGGGPELVAQGEIGGGGGAAADVIAQGEIGGGGITLPRAVELEKANGGDGFRLTGGKLIDRESMAGAGKRVALFDTKIWLHPEFEGLNCTNFEAKADDVGTGPMAGHGVFGAGLILRTAPKAELISVPVLDEDGSAQVWDVAKAMVAFLAADNPVDLIHMPWGAITPDGEEPLVLGAAIQRLRRAGVELVAAAGNHGDACTGVLRNAASYPAALPAVTAVGAAVRPKVAARFSPDPAAAPWIDKLRPGVGLVSTYLRDRYAIWGGSSFSAALYVGERAARG